MSRYKKHRPLGLRRREIAVMESVAMRSPFSIALQSHYMHCRQFAIIIIRDASCSWSVQDCYLWANSARRPRRRSNSTEISGSFPITDRDSQSFYAAFTTSTMTSTWHGAPSLHQQDTKLYLDSSRRRSSSLYSNRPLFNACR